MTPEQRAEYVHHLEAGMRRRAAAYVMEIPFVEVEGALAEDTQFALAVVAAEETATEHVEEALYQAAVSGSVPAAKLWLSLRGSIRSKPGPAPSAPGPEDEDAQAALSDLE